MQQLKVEHDSNNQKQKIVSKKNEVDREVKGLALSQTRNVFYLLGSKDTYYVQSERSNDIFYLVRYNPDVVEYCSCPDNSIRLEKCKHLHAVFFSIVKGTLKEVDHFNGKTFANQIPVIQQSKSWKDDQYDF